MCSLGIWIIGQVYGGGMSVYMSIPPSVHLDICLYAHWYVYVCPYIHMAIIMFFVSTFVHLY